MTFDNLGELGEEQNQETPDPVAEKLKELEELQAELDKRARDLNKGFMEISEREKRLEAESTRFQPADDDDDDDIPPLQPEAEKVLDKFVSKRLRDEIAPLQQIQQELYVETVNTEIAAEAERSGLTEEQIVETIQSLGLEPRDNSLSSAREVIKAASEIAKSRSFDKDAIIKETREQVLKELAEQGVKIEGVRPSRETPIQQEVDEDSMSPAERYAFIKSKQNL